MWPVLLLAAFAGGIIQPLTGFGAGVILMIVLSSFFDMTVAPTISVAICFFQSAILLWRLRKHLRIRRHLPVILTYTVASLGIVNLVNRFDLHLLTALFGAFLVILSIYFLFFARRVSVQPTLRSGLICGLVSGCCAGAFSIGGPTIALYYVAACEDKESYVAQMQFLFTVTNFALAAMRMIRGFYDVSLTPLLASCCVVIVAGTLVGLALSRRMDGSSARTVVYIGVGISGIITLIQQLA